MARYKRAHKEWTYILRITSLLPTGTLLMKNAQNSWKFKELSLVSFKGMTLFSNDKNSSHSKGSNFPLKYTCWSSRLTWDSCVFPCSIKSKFSNRKFKSEDTDETRSRHILVFKIRSNESTKEVEFVASSFCALEHEVESLLKPRVRRHLIKLASGYWICRAMRYGRSPPSSAKDDSLALLKRFFCSCSCSRKLLSNEAMIG